MIENISNTIYNKTMKFYIFLNFLILFLSCSKEYHLTSKNGIYFLNELYAEMDNSEEVSWHVGLKREIEISKGVRFYISVPKIESNSINLLNKKYGVDSWLYRFRKIERGAKKDLGLYSISFNNRCWRKYWHLNSSKYYRRRSRRRGWNYYHYIV